jgi:hypothetical protein
VACEFAADEVETVSSGVVAVYVHEIHRCPYRRCLAS